MMSASATATIPFERQSDPQIRRDCGAACLSMVYRSFGKEVAPAEIWPAIAKKNQHGSVASTTHLMVKDALSRGLAAVAFQASHPLQALRLCCEAGARAILNHRPSLDSPAGHYSVLVDVDARDVVLHDPFYGPARRVPHAELLELWQPGYSNSEIAGYLLIGIAAEPPAAPDCWLCGKALAPAVACPRCREWVALQPHRILGCIDRACLARMWNYVFCPFCDCGFSLNSQAAAEASALAGTANDVPPHASPATAKNPVDLGRALAEVDKFCNYLLTVPGAESHAEIKKKLEFIASSKEKLKSAALEALLHCKTHEQQMAEMTQTANENAESQRRRLEELQRPSPSLDASALGRALLKNLGFAV